MFVVLLLLVPDQNKFFGPIGVGSPNNRKTMSIPENCPKLDAAYELSRPYPQNLTILDLPNELLLEIFDHFIVLDSEFPLRGWDCPCGEGFESLVNTRLVCRRFCELASQKVIPVVSIALDEEHSLKRLEEISHHPTLAKGVRVIRICPLFYAPAFTDFSRYVSYHAKVISHYANPDYIYKSNPEQDPSVVDEMIANAKAIASFLERLASPDYNIGGHGEREEEDREWAVELHQEYVARLKRQELLVTSGKFSRVVASAMARLPASPDVWSQFSNYMLAPTSSSHTHRYNLGPLPSYSFLIDLVIKLRHKGVLLNGISVSLGNIGGPGSLVLAPDIRNQLSLCMQELRVFDFALGRIGRDPKAGNLNELLFACLDTCSLQSVNVLDNLRDTDGLEPIDLGKIMGSRSRKNLTRVGFSGLSTDLSKLIVVLKALAGIDDLLPAEAGPYAQRYLETGSG
ncbi:predicted protein [Chaetomium globosum CBS 148.51]|uniref:Uncharacterized protein n=1 Tax=Chaetomium globosum (strain ATCC 6205 / CBS 148.51 / DSM 1962 / NBRC 6347 / NRRL 1970) TaxID=306901 RepID=Q2GVG3_CHAGB|nr:uncharacterized protein CHGG_08041 [Chaetomium globosum CBS 148.51]EAQ86788.1 predicted protein [Chaetomium globosum CBS 148.51]